MWGLVGPAKISALFRFKSLAKLLSSMKAKDVRNLIITLVVVIVGVKIIVMISNRYINQANVAGFSGLIKGFTGLGDLVIYGIAIIAILLIPYYFSKRSGEKNALPNRPGPVGRE